VFFCDDFEAGFAAGNWQPPNGDVAVIAGMGPLGATHYAELAGVPLITTLEPLGRLPVTLSFWAKWNSEAEVMFVSFRDNTAATTRDIEFGLLNAAVRWHQIPPDVVVPSGPPRDYPRPNMWACVTITISAGKLEARIEQPGNVNEETYVVPPIDDTSTVQEDDEWLRLTAPQRFPAGWPAFGWVNRNIDQNKVWIDDVRFARGTSSSCP